jgi:flagellar biosynthesis protein FlhA
MEAVQKNFLGTMFQDKADLGMVIVVIGILVAMLLPLPPFMLDFLLALNIMTAIVVLITVMYAQSTLEFTIFPSLLLVLTLFRLALNVACSPFSGWPSTSPPPG